MNIKPLTWAGKKLLQHMKDTGGYLPCDPIRKPHHRTIDAMIRNGWVEQEGNALILTRDGESRANQEFRT